MDASVVGDGDGDAPRFRGDVDRPTGAFRGHSVSLHLLAHRGARLLGRLTAIEGRTLAIGDDLLDNVAIGLETRPHAWRRTPFRVPAQLAVRA